jgi:hypothetical protein
MECVTWWKPGNGPPNRSNWPTFRTQEIEKGPEEPDIYRPPDQELPDVADDTGVPPSPPGEDLEGPRRPERGKRQQDQPSN